MYSDPSGHSAMAIIIGLIVGAAFAFGGTVVNDLSDGELFNGDVSGEEYFVSTIIGGITGALGGATSNILIQVFASGVLDVTQGLILGEIDTFGEALGTFVRSAAYAGISFGISSAMGKVLGKIKYNNLRSISTKSSKVNSVIKQLGKKYKCFKGMRIGKNSMDEFISAFGKTASNLIFTNVYAGIIDTALVSVESLITNY